jgi:ATP-dependent Clp protease ATP-binding subunit ClpA
VFERFTERARQVVVLAQDEAVALKHNYIGTEHILLGLLREEEGLAARVLESLDITVEEVRAQVTRVIGQGDQPPTTGQIPFTPRAKKVLELALREAMALGHNYIGTEHILLGVARENQGVAARILLDFDVDAEKVRNEVMRMLGGRAVHPREDPELRAELERVREEKEEAIEAKEFEKATSLRDLERRLLRKLTGHAEFGGEPSIPPGPPRGHTYFRHPMQQVPLLPGWLLFAVSLGIGVFVGWAIWGL